MQYIERGDCVEATFVNVSHVLLFIFWLCTIRLMLTYNRPNSNLFKDLFQETINKQQRTWLT